MRAVAPTAGEAVVIAGAGGGVGVFAVQLRSGRARASSDWPASVIIHGCASAARFHCVR